MGQEAERIRGRYVRALVYDHIVPLSSAPRIPWQVCGGKGGHMAVTVQMQFTSAVTERYQDAFVGSAIENGTTIIQFDLRKHDFHHELGTQAKLWWRKESYHVDVHELSTFHNPMMYRFIVAQGSYFDDNNQRMYFTPGHQGCLDLPTYEPQRDPVGLLPRGGLRGQPQAHCAPLFSAVLSPSDKRA